MAGSFADLGEHQASITPRTAWYHQDFGVLQAFPIIPPKRYATA